MPIILGIAILIIDQLSKYLYVTVYGAPDITVIDHIINFTYVDNKGAAWGIFSDSQIFLYIVSGILIIALIFIYIRMSKQFDTLLKCAFMLIIAGALGNMLDRIFLGYVRDMISFAFMDFPVFNIADSAICIGAVLAAIDCLFLDGKKLLKEKDNDTEKVEVPDDEQ